MNLKNNKILLIILPIVGMLFSGCAATIPYKAQDQLDLHEKLSKKKMRIAVLPFTLHTAPDVKNIGFENVDVELTNKFTEIIWKKNKVRIANSDSVLNAIRDVDIKYNELDPEMDDLATNPNVAKIVEIGKKLNANVVFTGTIRTNEYEYEGGPIAFMPSFLADNRIYNIGAQMMAVDIDKGGFLAFDYINNKLAIPTKFLSITGKVSENKLAEGKVQLLEKCGFALAYYAPMPEQRTDTEAIVLMTGAALLNIYAGTEFSVDAAIQDNTWKMYPEGYFMRNFGYTRSDFDSLPR